MTTSKIPNLLREKFPTAEAVWEAILRLQFALILITLFLVCCSCGSTKAVTQLVEHTSVDTVYLSNVQYDSIYIYQDHVSEHHLGKLPPTDSKGQYLDIPTRTDTLFIKDKSIEYRYKLLRDTLYKTKVDSIPYQVTVTEVKEITRPLTWFDKIGRASVIILLVLVFIYTRRIINKYSKILKP